MKSNPIMIAIGKARGRDDAEDTDSMEDSGGDIRERLVAAMVELKQALDDDDPEAAADAFQAAMSCKE